VAKSGLHYDKVTGEIIGTVTVSQDSDLILNKIEGLELLEVDTFHEAIGQVHKFEVKQGKVKEKTQARIDKEEADKQVIENRKRIPVYLKSEEEMLQEIMLNKINELRERAGLADITPTDIVAEIEILKETYRNPEYPT
jgi:hypothetical protein